MNPISLIVITYNEVNRLRSMLIRHKPLVSEVVLVDQGSTDGTVASVVDLVDVYVRDKHWGYSEPSIMKACGYAEYDWILHLDADEKVTPEFSEQLASLTSPRSSALNGAYACHRENYVDGKRRIRPENPGDMQMRLFDKLRVLCFPLRAHEHVQFWHQPAKLTYPCIIHEKTQAEYDAAQARYAKLDAEGKVYHHE